MIAASATSQAYHQDALVHAQLQSCKVVGHEPS